ncbi:MAG: energy transducer TonB [Bacteroidota bacterium]
MKKNFFSLIFILLATTSFAQHNYFDVFGTHYITNSGPYFLVTLDTLNDAQRLEDINARFPTKWVDRFLSVEITATTNGITRQAISTDDQLTVQQMGLLKSAGPDTEVSVKVNYIPENSLQDNPPRQMDFGLKMLPIVEAKFPGGTTDLKSYLKQNTLDKIDDTDFEKIKLAAVRFDIDENGKVARAQLLESSADQQVDQMMLDVICNMPTWKPAKNAAGESISQEFEFRLGKHVARCDYSY